MRWEELTSGDFKKAVKKSKGVCIVSLGVIEKHGEHLPLGTDLLNSHATACRAAEIEPAVVFPPYYFTQIFEAQHQPGTIAIKSQLMFDLLENVCDEIERNGFKKIILLNGHGGNAYFLPYFVQVMLEKKKDYVVYFPRKRKDDKYEKIEKKMLETKHDAHGGERETSVTLANRPDLVKMEYITDTGESMNRSKHLPDIFTPMYWYANYPNHYAGQARPATKEKG